MSSFAFKVDPREAQYARLVFGVLGTLRGAVNRRVGEGLKQQTIADKAGMDKSALSRVLNGRTRNLTLKTISDILWACDFEPVEFEADALEDLSEDHVPSHLCTGTAPVQVSRMTVSHGLTPMKEQRTLEMSR